MRFLNDSLTLSPSSAMTASITSEAVNVQSMTRVAIQAIYTGSPVGSLKLQAANSLTSQTWTDVSNSTVAVSAAGNQLWNVSDIGYALIRVVYTFTSGSGTLEVIVSGKGD